MDKYVGYIRVSTAKQGERGVSLPEQKDAIGRFADRNGLSISQWFEERVTAAKQGRPVFNQMLKMLKAGQASGVIIHKIDRSARNLRDWADFIELSDLGIEVHIASENLDLRSRGGRLSADIQAVVAADYVRNLREETRKGMYGRLKQGYYPLPAPIGYLDRGKAQRKEPDPTRAPLIRKVFELYATGRYSIRSVLTEMDRYGLRNRAGQRLTPNGLSMILNNPFYAGIMRIRRTGEHFEGNHEPIVGQDLFRRVQRILRTKSNGKGSVHEFLFRRMIRCRECGYSLIGEVQKNHIYYRCHTPACAVKGVREEVVEEVVRTELQRLVYSSDEEGYLAELIAALRSEWSAQEETRIKDRELRLSKTQDRLERLTDAYIDRLIDKDAFEERRAALLFERHELQIQASVVSEQAMADHLQKVLELAKMAITLYDSANFDEKVQLLNIVTSNREFDGKNVAVELSFPFCVVAKRFDTRYGAPRRYRPRTWEEIVHKIAHWLLSRDHTTVRGITALLHPLKNEDNPRH